MSSGRATRFRGVMSAIIAFCSSGNQDVASVRVRPGATTLTRMPKGPTSSARERTKASRPDFAVEWAMKPGDEWRDRVLEIAIMLPDFLSIMPGSTAWQQKNIDLSSPESFASNSFQANSVKGFTGKPIEALLTRRSTDRGFFLPPRPSNAPAPRRGHPP